MRLPSVWCRREVERIGGTNDNGVAAGIDRDTAATIVTLE
jgi:hypothetical protein